MYLTASMMPAAIGTLLVMMGMVGCSHCHRRDVVLALCCQLSLPLLLSLTLLVMVVVVTC